MIYILLAVSVLFYFFLKGIRLQYEYFNIVPAPRNKKEKPSQTKISLLVKPRILFQSFFKHKNPNWKIVVDKSKQRKLTIVKGIGHFVSIFCMVAFAFTLLQLWSDFAFNVDGTQATILKIEETQEAVKKWMGYFKIGSMSDILILFLLIALAGWFPFLEKHKVKAKLKKYNKAVKSILYVLSISTSFTFFGNRFSAHEEGVIAELQFHKVQVLKDKKLLAKKIEAEIIENIINELLLRPEVEKALDDMEEIKKNINKTKENQTYKNFVSTDEGQYNNLAVESFGIIFGIKYDFDHHVAELEKRVDEQMRDAYGSKESKKTTKDKSSRASVKKADEALSASVKKNKKAYSKHYKKYKEPLEKLLKKGYRATLGKLITNVFDNADMVFLDEFVGPIIHEPIEDYITKKTENVFKHSAEGNTQALKNEFDNLSSSLTEKIPADIKNSKEYKRFQQSIAKDLASSQKLEAITLEEISTIREKTTKVPGEKFKVPGLHKKIFYFPPMHPYMQNKIYTPEIPTHPKPTLSPENSKFPHGSKPPKIPPIKKTPKISWWQRLLRRH